mgnify:CR=1 FL=1
MGVPTAAERRFVLRLAPTEAGDDWGMALVETTGDHKRAIADLPASKANQYRRYVCEAVTAAGPGCMAANDAERWQDGRGE